MPSIPDAFSKSSNAPEATDADGRTVYALYDKRQPRAFAYVGATTQVLRQRLSQHKTEARHSHQAGHDTPKSRWMRQVGVDNVEITALPGFTDEAQAIEMLGLYCPLVNSKRADSRRAERASLTWDETSLFLLGEVPDRVIAERLGCSLLPIVRMRQKQGIEAAGTRKLSDCDVFELRVMRAEDAISPAEAARSPRYALKGSDHISAAAKGKSYAELPFPSASMPATALALADLTRAGERGITRAGERGINSTVQPIMVEASDDPHADIEPADPFADFDSVSGADVLDVMSAQA